MNANAVPTTLVKEIMVPVEDTLCLDAQDGPREAMDKGLYSAPARQTVVAYDGDAVIAVISASELRGSVLPRSWRAPLGERLSGVGRPPQTTAQTLAVELLFLVQDNRRIEWLAVVDEKTGELVGVLDRRRVLKLVPTSEPEVVFRGASMRLYGVAGVQNVYYYCKVEDCIYGPNAVHPDTNGRMRDLQGHLVEVRKPAG
jgi:CBS domain-containing protein